MWHEIAGLFQSKSGQQFFWGGREMKTKLVGLVTSLAFLGTAFQATASPVNDALFYAYVDVSGTTQTQSGATPVTSSLTNGGASATATTASQPSPNLTATASVSGNGAAIANASIQYFFDVSGPPNVQVPVPVYINGNGAVTASNMTNTAALYFDLPSGTVILGSACISSGNGCSSAPTNSPSFSVAVPQTVTSNTQYEIQLNLFVYAYSAGGVDFASGYVDPTITFQNPADAALFSIITSSGVGNAPATTPLPAALPSLRQRPRRIGSARLAQEAEERCTSRLIKTPDRI
jgi:hypothetical protein